MVQSNKLMDIIKKIEQDVTSRAAIYGKYDPINEMVLVCIAKELLKVLSSLNLDDEGLTNINDRLSKLVGEMEK